MNNFLKQFFKIGLPLLVGVYLTWYFFHQMSEEATQSFYRALRETNYWVIALSLAIGVLTYWSRAYRWKYTLEPLGHTSSSWNRYHSLMIGYIVNLTIPRAGEASRAMMLQRSDNVPFSVSFGTIITERIVDVVLLMSITLVTMAIGKNDFWHLYHEMLFEFGAGEDASQKSLLYILLISFVSLGLVLFLVPKTRTIIVQFAKSLVNGIFSIFKLAQPWSYLGHTALIWIGYIVMFALPYYSLNETMNVPFEGILIAFIAGSLGISFTNGGIGTYPLLVGFVTAFYLKRQGVEDALAIANALGMLIWASQALIMLVMGLASLYFLPKNYDKDAVTK